ncbi:leucine-rich repeat domain-containing protein [Chryseobacterium sp. CBSDS_008]|uniref:leucine-rich repeat domain-containing protein n=1 Tax=Chryseobacterium sp. CBSDS_008 TaxID=3415265 RepID=UPI003CF4462E
MRNIIMILLLAPLLLSCQKYNKDPYDKFEEDYRKMTSLNPDKIYLDSLWSKRDSLTYLNMKNVELVLLSETDSIPNWLFNFKNLKIIFTNNELKKIKRIPSNIDNAKGLMQFDIPNNAINNIPKSFYKLNNLETTDLSKNPIKELSPDIENLLNLRGLTLRNTLISNLPSEICKLSKLESLVLENTKIYELPKCLGNLQHLEWINISGTQITEFPIEILNAPKLETIHARGLKLKNYKEVKAICEKRNITFYYDHE